MSFRAGFVGLIGEPNAGKSTLLNMLVEEKVSIVTPKPQTTRRRSLGILNHPEYQIVLVDAPGVVKSTTGMNKFLEAEVVDVMSSVEALVAVLNIDEENKETLEKILDLVSKSGKPWMAVITKVDMSQYFHRVSKLKEMIRERKSDVDILEVSSKRGSDIAAVRLEFGKMASRLVGESPAPLYDLELFTPHTERELVAEIVREKCFEELHQEVPYQLAVRIIKFDEEDPRIKRIYAEILLSKENHKPIVIGKGGAQIKLIGTKARNELEKFLGTKVYLDLKVQVKEEWYLNPQIMKELGYVIASE